MILEHVRMLNERHIVLASASPRRAQLLSQIGLTNVDIVPSSFEENLDKKAFGGPKGYAKETARCKALDVVEVDGLVLEKPADAVDAANMLQRLSGKEHQVHTGFTLVAPQQQNKTISWATSTRVTFGRLTPQEIEAYIATGECFGKAGAYGIQGPAGVWTKQIEGCYFNIMGLPLYDLATALHQMLPHMRGQKS